VQADLARSDIDIEAVGRDAHHRADRAALVVVPPTPLRTDQVKVRRSLFDRLFLRSQNAIRKNLFGPPDTPGHRLPVATKTARLGDIALTSIRKQLATYDRAFFTETANRIISGFTRGYGERVATAIRQQLRDRRATLEDQAAVLATELSNGRRLLDPLDALREQTESAQATIQRLSTHYAQMDLFMLTQPTESEVTLPAAPPAPAPQTSASDAQPSTDAPATASKPTQ
jgi:hypothetical protein